MNAIEGFSRCCLRSETGIALIVLLLHSLNCLRDSLRTFVLHHAMAPVAAPLQPIEVRGCLKVPSAWVILRIIYRAA